MGAHGAAGGGRTSAGGEVREGEQGLARLGARTQECRSRPTCQQEEEVKRLAMDHGVAVGPSRSKATTIQLMGRCFIFRWMRYDPYGSLTNWDYNDDYEP